MKLKTRRMRRLDRRGLSGPERPSDEIQPGSLALLADLLGRLATRGVVSSREVVDVRSAIASDAAFTAFRVDREE